MCVCVCVCEREREREREREMVCVDLAYPFPKTGTKVLYCHHHIGEVTNERRELGAPVKTQLVWC